MAGPPPPRLRKVQNTKAFDQYQCTEGGCSTGLLNSCLRSRLLSKENSSKRLQPSHTNTAHQRYKEHQWICVFQTYGTKWYIAELCANEEGWLPLHRQVHIILSHKINAGCGKERKTNTLALRMKYPASFPYTAALLLKQRWKGIAREWSGIKSQFWCSLDLHLSKCFINIKVQSRSQPCERHNV